MLATLLPLDARELQPWKLDEAQAIKTDFRHHSFQSYHRCAIDHDRIAFDQRLITDLLGLDDEALNIIARLSILLASEPSIHGAKEPALP